MLLTHLFFTVFSSLALLVHFRHPRLFNGTMALHLPETKYLRNILSPAFGRPEEQVEKYVIDNKVHTEEQLFAMTQPHKIRVKEQSRSSHPWSWRRSKHKRTFLKVISKWLEEERDAWIRGMANPWCRKHQIRWQLANMDGNALNIKLKDFTLYLPYQWEEMFFFDEVWYTSRNWLCPHGKCKMSPAFFGPGSKLNTQLQKVALQIRTKHTCFENDMYKKFIKLERHLPLQTQLIERLFGIRDTRGHQIVRRFIQFRTEFGDIQHDDTALGLGLDDDDIIYCQNPLNHKTSRPLVIDVGDEDVIEDGDEDDVVLRVA